RYPFHVSRLESLNIPTFPLINLWEGEDDQVPELLAQAKSLGFRKPIVGNLFRDGGDGLADQLDDFVSVISEDTKAYAPESRRGNTLMNRIKLLCEEAYGVPANRIIEKDGFADSLSAAQDLCANAGVDFNSLALVAVKSPATMTDDDHAPEDSRTVTLKKVEVHAGAGVVQVNLTSSLTTPMPKIV
ncbi:MAG: formate--tetrahydrofolate ligase, partial [Gardnerella vaginalis]